MTATTLASMTEITRVGGWALRGLGFPFGVAERATRLLAWTEAVHGGAVRAVHDQEPLIARAARARPVARTLRADGGHDVEGFGRHLLEIGPPLVDLATAGARRRGEGHARLNDAHGFLFVGALADLLAHRRLAGLVVYRAAPNETLPAEIPPTGWILVGASGEPSFAAGRPGDAVSLKIAEGLSGARRALADDLAAIARPGPGFLAVAAFSADHPAAADLAALAGAAARDYPERLARAYREGVPMAARDLQDLYDLEIRTWAPTSERSRSQAGYGKF